MNLRLKQAMKRSSLNLMVGQRTRVLYPPSRTAAFVAYRRKNEEAEFIFSIPVLTF